MRLRTRLQRLEQKQAPRGRCALCRDRAPKVLTSASMMPASDNDRDVLEPNTEPRVQDSTDDTLPCLGCGWQPEVIVVEEVIIDAEEDSLVIEH
jgi:hypothetical protein